MFYQLRYSCLVLLTLSLVACGFHLRGHADLPPAFARVYIDSLQPYGKFEQALRQVLRDNDVKLVQSSKQASLIIQLASSKIAQSSTSISASNQTREYNLVLNVRYQLLLPKGKVAMSQQTISASRQYTASVNQMLANDSQAQSLESDIYNDAVFFMMNRLSSQQTREALKQAMSSP